MDRSAADGHEGAQYRSGAVFGWDVGGAHVKAARLEGGRLVDAAQWPCPLWQGLDHLRAALGQAAERWPDLHPGAHAVTMTGEMVDLFADREDGVRQIATVLAERLHAPHCFAGDQGFVDGLAAGAHWRAIASANWLATARHVALALAPAAGLLVDIGSTTTDLIAFRGGRVLGTSRTDADRLASGELLYHGVVRTPLCALGPRIAWQGRELNVMNEFFATTADVYRLTGELDPAHDQQPSADGQAKDAAHTAARLARMVGLDARDGSAGDWQAFARAWRERQLGELRANVARVAAAHGLGSDTVAVAAGCGGFLVDALVPATWARRDYGRDIAAAGGPLAAWAAVSAPAVATASLFVREHR